METKTVYKRVEDFVKNAPEEVINAARKTVTVTIEHEGQVYVDTTEFDGLLAGFRAKGENSCSGISINTDMMFKFSCIRHLLSKIPPALLPLLMMDVMVGKDGEK